MSCTTYKDRSGENKYKVKTFKYTSSIDDTMCIVEGFVKNENKKSIGNTIKVQFIGESIFELQTSISGHFVKDLPSGVYTIKIQEVGFHTFESRDINIPPKHRKLVDIFLITPHSAH